MSSKPVRWFATLLLSGLLTTASAGVYPPLQLDSLRQLLRWPVATQVRLLSAQANVASGRFAEGLLLKETTLAPAVQHQLLLHVTQYYFVSARPASAALRALECRQLAITRHDSAGRSQAAAVLSYAYTLLEQPQSALTYATEAVRFAQGPDKRHLLLRGYNFMAGAAAQLGNRPMQLRSEKQSLRLARLEHQLINEAIILQQLARTYLDLGNYSVAARYLDSARTHNHQLSPPEQANLPLLQARLADAQGHHLAAVRLLLAPLREARRTEAIYYETEVLPVLVQALRNLGRSDDALSYQQRLTELRGRLFQQATLRQAQELQTIYETERRERDLARQRRRIAALLAQERLRQDAGQKRTIMAVGALVFGAGALLYFGYRRRRARARREQNLRSRIAADLHDEVGTLLTRISMQAQLLRELLPGIHRPSLDQLLTNSRTAARIMRDIVWGIDAQADTVGALLDRMRDYLDQCAAPAGLVAHLVVAGLHDEVAIGAEVRQQLYIIFKEAVANAVRHAHQATHLQVELRQDARRIHLVVQDDAPPSATPPVRSGMGMRNMRQRAISVGGAFEAGPVGPSGGFRVEALLPL